VRGGEEGVIAWPSAYLISGLILRLSPWTVLEYNNESSAACHSMPLDAYPLNVPHAG
jgi:hypothetical protein